MLLRKTSLIVTAIIVLVASTTINAQVIIDNLDVRVNGIFGHNDNVGDPGSQTIMLNGGPAGTDGTAMLFDPIIYEITYANVDVEGDGTANDTIDFTLMAEGGTAGINGVQRIFGQGIDTGFGALNNVTVTISDVSGTTTDSGMNIVFDGFWGAEVGAGTGAGSALDRSVEINGTTVAFDPLDYPDTGAFQFAKLGVDFASLQQSVLFDNSGGAAGPGEPGVGSLVARTYDLQFSATDTPIVDGDFNDDGVYDCADVDALTVEVTGATNNLDFDLTGDGLVDLNDRDAWLLEAGEANIGPGQAYLVGDASLDGVVDVSDFGIWNSNKFTNTAAWCSGDFSMDGVVDVSDFGGWNANKFTSSDAAAVPEPTALSLIGIALLGMMRIRRRS